MIVRARRLERVFERRAGPPARVALDHSSAFRGVRVTDAESTLSAYATVGRAPLPFTHVTVVQGSTNSPIGSKK